MAAKMIESGHPWTASTSSTSVTDSYQYQLQSMWQKCWNTNQQNLVQQLRFRERGPLKSWRPEAMAEAIFSVLKEGLSLSQAARKYDIPYPTFVLYANRVHNMLGPSLDGGSDPRPKARGRPQRILLGMWPDDLIRSVIKAVVFRDYREIKDELGGLSYVNGQPNVPPHFSNPNTIITNGMHNAAKLAVQNTILASQESSSPLNSMTESFRRHIISQQQQQSPASQNMNLYKSPAYLQRSEMTEQAPDLLSKQMNERRSTENLADLSKLGLMNLSGMNTLPSSGSCGNQSMHPNANAYAMEREMECSREKERDHKLKEAIQARQFGNCSRGSATGAGDGQKQVPPSCFSTGPSSPYPYFKNKDHAIQYAYNKKFLENLPPGIDFEAIANGLFQKSAVKSPRFEDLFSGQDANELLANNETGIATAFPSQRDSNLMQIKLEQQQITEMQNEVTKISPPIIPCADAGADAGANDVGGYIITQQLSPQSVNNHYDNLGMFVSYCQKDLHCIWYLNLSRGRLSCNRPFKGLQENIHRKDETIHHASPQISTAKHKIFSDKSFDSLDQLSEYRAKCEPRLKIN
uniref:HTH psq-type domain-containing protein n=1 Tax=Glossina brevipalpis TaxID=37001 RepID=A0A1A9X2V7_9MUSC